MTTSRVGQSNRDPGTRRYACAFCHRAKMWPDLCSEAPGAADARCAKEIERQCSSRGDHRRCEASTCTVAARWREPVQQAGMEAARAAGAVWAVVSTLENEVQVLGTETNLGRAKSRLRNVALWRAGIPYHAEEAGRVYIVRGSDGGFV